MNPYVERALHQARTVATRVESLPPRQRLLAAAAAVAVLVLVSVTVGVLVGRSGPAAQADEADAFAVAPNCETVPGEAVDSVVPSAALETARRGPLPDSNGTTCVWTSFGAGDAAPRFLHVDFRAHFTDKAGEVSGAAAAAEQLGQLAPVGQVEGAGPTPSLGEGALAWPNTAEGGTAEVALRRDNLVIRVVYGGDYGTDGSELSYEEAREGAVSVAERVTEAL